MLDESGSMRHYASAMRSLVRSLYSQFELSDSWTRIGVVEFSSTSRKSAPLTASQSVLGRNVQTTVMFGQRPEGDNVSDIVSNVAPGDIGGEPFGGTTSRILMGDNQGTSNRNLGRR